MTRIDLDDLPPRIARALAELGAGDEVILVQGGVVVSRLTAAAGDPPSPEPASDADMREVMEHFDSIIHDEF